MPCDFSSSITFVENKMFFTQLSTDWVQKQKPGKSPATQNIKGKVLPTGFIGRKCQQLCEKVNDKYCPNAYLQAEE